VKMSQHKVWGAILLVTLLLAGGVEVASAANWVFLGERVVADRVDHDVIAVTGARGSFSALKLVVRRRPVHFLDMKVHFANGSVQDVSLRTVIPAGGESRVIDLSGEDRTITRVEFWYEANSIGVGKTALVRLFGRR